MARRSTAALAIGAVALVAAVFLGAWAIGCHLAARTAPDPTGALGAPDAPDGFPAVDWAHWQSVNPDVIGWITIPGTTVDYPILQAPADDPTFYLRHDVYRAWNYVGVPYLDAGCVDGLLSENTAIFAHHIKVGEPMFAPLASYPEAAFAEAHGVVLIQTPTAKRRLAVMAAARIRGSSLTKRVSFEGPEDFRAWYAERLDEAAIVRDGAIPARTTTLITCSYELWPGNERTVVYAADPSDIGAPSPAAEAA